MTSATPVAAARQLRVAVVDDDEGIRALLEVNVALDDRFELAASACDGESAIALLERADIDAMVLDMHMGLLTGPMVLMAARARRPAMRVVAYSADSAMLQAAARSGAAATILKGESIDGLLDALVGHPAVA
jgi:DNA-binding NarL/FixJ family response regulator